MDTEKEEEVVAVAQDSRQTLSQVYGLLLAPAELLHLSW